MPDNLSAFLSLASLVVTFGAVLGGLFAFQRGRTKQLGEVQQQVIETYKEQNEAQERQIAALKQEIARMKRVIETIRQALKSRGLRIEISDETITLIDDQERRTHTRQISIQDTKLEEEEDN